MITSKKKSEPALPIASKFYDRKKKRLHGQLVPNQIHKILLKRENN